MGATTGQPAAHMCRDQVAASFVASRCGAASRRMANLQPARGCPPSARQKFKVGICRKNGCLRREPPGCSATAFMSKVHFSIAFINSLTTLPQVYNGHREVVSSILGGGVEGL